ncbi:MAG: DUF4124 domain-containing protein [Betaproteobacteria bacterium]
MPRQTMMQGFRFLGSLRWAVAFAFCAAVPIANAQVYKCTDANGKTTYGDNACDAAAKPLKLPEDPKKNNTNPRMCEQLLDETTRLNAEADRAAKRGAAESADNAKRRVAMTKQYESRCAGISRAVTK